MIIHWYYILYLPQILHTRPLFFKLIWLSLLCDFLYYTVSITQQTSLKTPVLSRSFAKWIIFMSKISLHRNKVDAAWSPKLGLEGLKIDANRVKLSAFQGSDRYCISEWQITCQVGVRGSWCAAWGSEQRAVSLVRFTLPVHRCFCHLWNVWD